MTELEQMINKATTEDIEILKNGEVPEDDMTIEILKKSGETEFKNLEQIVKKAWREKEIPEDWNLSILYPIYKKEDTMNYKNYRDISLLDTSYKVLSNVLLNKLKPYGDEIIGEY